MNEGLTVQFGVYHASLYIHIVEAIFATVILTAKKRLPRLNRQIPWWMYLGGVIGVFTTVFNNVAFSHISLTSIVVLGLFAQLSCSWLIDRFGLFGMQKQDENQLSIPGLLISMVGIIFMLDQSMADGGIYVLISLGAGVTVVLSRIVNAHLSERIGALQGSLINHMAGIPLCLILTLIMTETTLQAPFRLWIWCGGILGVITVTLCNVILLKMSVSQMTLLGLFGQLLCGIAIDILAGNAVNSREFQASLLVAAGILVSRFVEYSRTKKTVGEQK